MGKQIGGGTAVSVATAETTLAEIVVGQQAERITVNVDNAGAQALNSFKVYTRAHPQADWYEHALTVASVVEAYDTALGTLAAAADGEIVLNARGWHSFKLTATVASSTATVTPRWTQA